MYFDWMARNGYYQYDPNIIKPWNPSDPQTPVYGDQIAYYQHWLTVSPGIAVSIPIRSRWVVEVSMNAVPGLIWVWSLDKHIGRQIEFQDYPTGGVLLEGGVEVSYSFNTRLALAGHASYRDIRRSRGDDLQTGGGYPGWHDNTAGAGFHALDAGLTLKVFF
jgi:outer membrane protease